MLDIVLKNHKNLLNHIGIYNLNIDVCNFIEVYITSTVFKEINLTTLELSPDRAEILSELFYTKCPIAFKQSDFSDNCETKILKIIERYIHLRKETGLNYIQLVSLVRPYTLSRENIRLKEIEDRLLMLEPKVIDIKNIEESEFRYLLDLEFYLDGQHWRNIIQYIVANKALMCGKKNLHYRIRREIDINRLLMISESLNKDLKEFMIESYYQIVDRVIRRVLLNNLLIDTYLNRYKNNIIICETNDLMLGVKKKNNKDDYKHFESWEGLNILGAIFTKLRYK